MGRRRPDGIERVRLTEDALAVLAALSVDGEWWDADTVARRLSRAPYDWPPEWVTSLGIGRRLAFAARGGRCEQRFRHGYMGEYRATPKG